MKRSTLILLAVILALGGLILYNRMDRQAEKPMAIPKLEAEVAKILIERRAEEPEDDDAEATTNKPTIHLQKEGDEWLIGEGKFLANKGKVNNLITEVTKSRRIDKITDLETDYRYELDEEKRLVVNLMNDEGESIRRFQLGKKSPSGNHVFIKKDADPSIYSTIDSLTAIVDVEVEALREKKIFSFQSNAARSLSLAEGEETIQIAEVEVKNEQATDENDEKNNPKPEAQNVWQDQEGNQYDDEKIKRLISILSGLQAESFVDKSLEALQDEKTFRQWSLTVNNQTYTLVILKDKENEQWRAYSPSRKYGFLLKEQDAEQLTEEVKAFYEQEKS